MRLDNLTTSPRKSSKYRCSGFECFLAHDCRQVSFGPGCCHDAIELSGFRKGNVDGFLGSEENFRYFHGGIPAFFEHDFSLFAERSSATLNSVL